MNNYSILATWDRFHIYYFQSLGALSLLPNSTCRYDYPESRFVFNYQVEQSETFWKTDYCPSAIYSPWNARSFGGGFQECVKLAREIPRLASYVGVVEFSKRTFGEEVPLKGKVGSPKEEMLIKLLSGEVVLSDSHSEWTNACWELEVPESKRKKAKLHARPLTGAGGCEASLDYGALFLRAAVAHFSGKNFYKEWSLGGLAYPDSFDVGPRQKQWYRWTPFDILLLLEGVRAASAALAPWHENGMNRGKLSLPVWKGEKSWSEIKAVLKNGWDGKVGVVYHDVEHVQTMEWSPDGQMMRGRCANTFQRIRRRQKLDIVLRYSEEEEGWISSVLWTPEDVDGPQPQFFSELGNKDEVIAKAMAEIEENFGDEVAITVKEIET